MIASNKTTTEDHRNRLRFVEKLQEAFPGEIDLFGRGIRTVEDKADAIFPYEYHIVLENDHSEYYVSEKLTDSYLGWAYPFYSGSPHADALLPEGAFARINMVDHEESIQTIRRVMDSNRAIACRETMGIARRKVLAELNQFAWIQNHFAKLLPSKDGAASEVKHSRKSKCVLYPKRFAIQQILGKILR